LRIEQIRLEGRQVESVFIEGELTDAFVQAFVTDLRALSKRSLIRPLVVDLSRLDIEGGETLAATVECLREARADGRLIIRGAPQILAHNLYRIGALGGRRPIELEGTRKDEAGE
jgi:hypothetical protein